MKLTLFIVTLFLFVTSAFGLTLPVKKLVQFETQANGAGKRSTEMVLLPHVEIPMDMVGYNLARRIDMQIANSLIIEKNGKKYMRWILNPEDTKWGQEVIAHFAKKGLELSIQHHFRGYQTASRSYIVEDPVTGAQFSVKSSTNVTGGKWSDKKQPVGEAYDGRLISNFLFEQNQKRAFENFEVMDEPAMLKISSLDQAVVIRDIGKIKNIENKNFFVPGFAVLHENLGKQIALANGSTDPHAFWTEHYIKSTGRALGELAARTGLQFDSPHSQNFLVELDERLRPTGKIIFRDMSDLFLDVNFLKALDGESSKLLTQFTQSQNKLNFIGAGFGPLHGNVRPSWISQDQYNQWKDAFFDAFEAKFEDVSGFDLKKLKVERKQNNRYFRAAYKLHNEPEFQNLLKDSSTTGVVRIQHRSCQQLFSTF